MTREVRRALVAHMENVRSFAQEVINVDYGVYDVSRQTEVIRWPSMFIQIETEWINGFLEAMQIISQNIAVVDRWVRHVQGIASNLNITTEEIGKIERGEATAKDLLQSKHFDRDYLHWVVRDISQEADRLIAETQHQMGKAVRLLDLTERIGGPFMEKVKRITAAWIEERRGFHTTLTEILQDAHKATTSRELLSHLGAYIDTLAWLVRETPMFPIGPSTRGYTQERLIRTKDFVDKLLEATKCLEEAVALRTKSYFSFLTHIEVLLHAVLPLGASTTQWMLTYAKSPDKTADDLLPTPLRLDTLPLAIRQAEEALTIWNTTRETVQSLLEKVSIFNDLLKSPSFSKFLAADLQRLKITCKWQPKIMASFQALAQTLNNEKDADERVS